MKVIIASDSFKGCCTSIQVADAFEKGILNVFPDAVIVKLPVADGGEGTVDAMVSGLGGEFREIYVTGPMGGKVHSRYGIIDRDSAVIEMAAASGLTLIPRNKRNPLKATTYGTGELIKDALEMGCNRIIIGIGGSATNDGGVGMAQALGVSFTDGNGKELEPGGGKLGALAQIDPARIDPRISQCNITALCDVSNPLCGENGATYVYGLQKGARPEDLPFLDRNLRHYAEVLFQQMGKDVMNIPGAGAAGGLGAGLMAFCNAELRPGIETILKFTGFETQLAGADLVITGEGRIDGQSVFGKVPAGVAKIAKKQGVPVIAIAGSIGDGADGLYDLGIDSMLAITPGPMTLAQAIRDFPILAEKVAERMMRIFRL